MHSVEDIPCGLKKSRRVGGISMLAICRGGKRFQQLLSRGTSVCLMEISPTPGTPLPEQLFRKFRNGDRRSLQGFQHHLDYRLFHRDSADHAQRLETVTDFPGDVPDENGDHPLFFPWIVLICSHAHICIINIDILFCQRFRVFIYNIILIDNIN